MFTTSATRRGELPAALTRSGRAAWVTYSSACTLSAIIRSHSSVLVPRAGPSSITPALLTTVSSPPARAPGRPPAPLLYLVGELGQPVEPAGHQADGRPLGRQPPSGRRPDPADRPGDQRGRPR